MTERCAVPPPGWSCSREPGHEPPCAASPVAKEAGIVLVVRDDGDVLVTSNRRYGGWCLPGGKVEPGETPLAAAAREFGEEAGAYVAPEHLVWICAGPSPTETTRVVHCFLARAITGDPHDVEDGTTVRWMTLEELRATEPFGAYYRDHLRGGVLRLKPTRFL